ncbi:hypothetical protein [Natrinema versiforme]|uniref:Uncharacterized protein n=1 Tax=Natrinema versiforme JCM 10478 TaxID=1227496 RepID=L9YCS7_9EURY|nr:hypothetical protein [Natrinema versiforme]ELY71492.1 hypothetical protein C489_00271 [Natrinema versiforme JCM 10478]
MLDREDRIVFGSLLALVLAIAGSLVVDRQFGLGIQDWPLLSYLLFAGVAVALPQLYLAITDDETARSGDRSRSRLRFAAVATAAFALAFAADAEGLAHLVIGVIGSGSLVALVCYEVLTDYQSASDESVTRVS